MDDVGVRVGLRAEEAFGPGQHRVRGHLLVAAEMDRTEEECDTTDQQRRPRGRQRLCAHEVGHRFVGALVDQRAPAAGNEEIDAVGAARTRKELVQLRRVTGIREPNGSRTEAGDADALRRSG